MSLLDHIDFDEQGLVPVIAQDADSGKVLMLAYMNEAALRKTLRTERMTYWSRSRQALWTKGETSGRGQRMQAIYLDCDGDTLLFEVEQEGGAACHTGHPSCFYRRVEDDGQLVEEEERVFDPAFVYGEQGNE